VEKMFPVSEKSIMNKSFVRHQLSTNILYRSLVLLSFLCFSASIVTSQTKYNTSNSPDKTLKSSARVNPSTLAMELTVPITSYPGRAGNSLPINFSYNSKVWEVKPGMSWESASGSLYTDAWAAFAEKNAAGWTSGLGSPSIDYQFDLYDGEDNPATQYPGYVGQVHSDYESPYGGGNTGSYNYYVIKRLRVMMPDGSSHEFRADDTILLCGNPSTGCAVDQSGTYLSVDGSKLRLTINSDRSAVLYMPDGSFYGFDSNTIVSQEGHPANRYTDRHGNTMNYDVVNRRWTDTLGRVITNPIPSRTSNLSVGDVTANFPSINGTTSNVVMSWRYLKDPNGGESGLNDPNQSLSYVSSIYCQGNIARGAPGAYLFAGAGREPRLCGPGFNTSGPPFNPIVLTKITLANGQSYQFKYNLYGEIEKIIYPSGAYERFNYAKIEPLQVSKPGYDQANRGVVDRWVSAKGDGTDESHWSYAVSRGTTQSPAPYKVVSVNPDNTRTEYFLHDESNPQVQRPYGFDNVKTGRPYETRTYSSTNQLVRRTLISYKITGPLAGGFAGATRDIRPEQEISITFEPNSSSALASMTETVYDSSSDPSYFAELNAKQSKTYNYVALALSTAQNGDLNTIRGLFSLNELAKIDETDYLYNANYKARNLVALPIETRVKNASGAVFARSQIVYDEAAYPILNAGSDAQWVDPQTVTRGNATTVRTYTNTLISAQSYIDTHAQYDNFGNLRKSWDAKNNLSETEYSVTYKFAYPTLSRTTVPDPSGQRSSSSPFEAAITYDLVTGLPLSTTDINGHTTYTQFNDPLLRPTKIIPPNSGGATEIIYNDVPGANWVKTRKQIDGTNWKESIVYTDGLGRIKATQEGDVQGDVFTETIYDSAGHIKQVSNPFRVGESKLWTVTNYDARGRAFQVVTPDGSSMQTDYDIVSTGKIGLAKTITDQAGKKSTRIADALNNTFRVVEDPAGQNLVTDYIFDTTGNLRQTIQGEQNRYFLYDSLGRLLRAKQPEQANNPSLSLSDPITGNTQWSVGYDYDGNGNLTSTMDARGIVITNTYDNLNRIVNRDYSDNTADAIFKYDGVGESISNPKGRLTEENTAVSINKYTAFDNTGKIKSSQQTTAGQTYVFADYSYNLAGQLVSEIYPSGRVVSNSYRADGELSQVGASSGGQNKVYVSNIAYHNSGSIAAMQMGNGLWETTQLNSRLQLTQVGLGTSTANQDLLKLDYSYGINDNNGSMKSQQITIQNQFVANQNYTYDNLNRLSSSQEVINSQQNWKQVFLYDRYGNRKFDVAQTTTLGGCPQAVCNPDASTASNRLDNLGYDQAGNITNDANGKLFSYDGESRQTEVKNSSNQVIGTYIYDGKGKRVQKISNQENTIFVYDAFGKMISEYSFSNTASQTPQTAYLTEDHLGSPRVVTNQAGAVISRHDYMAFGEEIYRQSYNNDSLRDKYTGYEKDFESDLDYAQARYYNSRNGRFTSVDPAMASATARNPQSFNRYIYGLNSPYKFNDPTGLLPNFFGWKRPDPNVVGTVTINTNDDKGTELIKQMWFLLMPRPPLKDRRYTGNERGTLWVDVITPQDPERIAMPDEFNDIIFEFAQLEMQSGYDDLAADAAWFLNQKTATNESVSGSPDGISYGIGVDYGSAPPSTLGKNDGNFKQRLEQAIDKSNSSYKSEMKGVINEVMTKTATSARKVGENRAAGENRLVQQAMSYPDFKRKIRPIRGQ
jgi:RHS repeat-associated protein